MHGASLVAKIFVFVIKAQVLKFDELSHCQMYSWLALNFITL